MKWSNKLYIGKGVPPLHEVKWNLSHNAGMVEIYIIVLSDSGEDLLEIYPSYVFFQPHLKNREFTAVGVVRGYFHAVRMVRDIIDEMYVKTGGFDVYDFFDEPHPVKFGRTEAG